MLNRLPYSKKIPAIPPLFVDGSFISDYCKKTHLFNNFFVSICTPIKNNGALPPILYKTNTRVNSFRVTNKDTLSIINSLQSSKSRGYDNISIKMIKICSEPVIIPLRITFQESLKKEIFPEIWKEANVVPIHKKEDNTLIKNYRPISLLPIFGKIFERVIYDSLFNNFPSNKLFAPSQSGFLPGDSCIAQLPPIIHEIQTAFDNNPTLDQRGVFLDISKAFDKVWHTGLVF